MFLLYVSVLIFPNKHYKIKDISPWTKVLDTRKFWFYNGAVGKNLWTSSSQSGPLVVHSPICQETWLKIKNVHMQPECRICSCCISLISTCCTTATLLYFFKLILGFYKVNKTVQIPPLKCKFVSVEKYVTTINWFEQGSDANSSESVIGRHFMLCINNFL